MTVVRGASLSAVAGFPVIRAGPVGGFLGLDAPPRRDRRLTLSSHGRCLAIGSFLTPEQRRQLARALRAALEHQRAASGP